MTDTEKKTEEAKLTPFEKIAKGVELTAKENAELARIERKKASDILGEVHR